LYLNYFKIKKHNTKGYTAQFVYEKRLPIIACLLFVLVYYPLNYWCKHTCFWYSLGWNSTAKTYVCELQFIDGVIRQPMSTFTNIFYLFFGVEMMVNSYTDYHKNQGHPNLLVANFQYSLMFGLCLLVLFFGSTLARFYNNKPYFSMLGSMIVVAMFFLVQGVLTSYYWQDESSYYILPMLYFTLIGATGYHNLYYVQKSERNNLFYDWYYCDEMSYFQPHALWHIFSALSMYYFYIFLRSEHNATLKP